MPEIQFVYAVRDILLRVKRFLYIGLFVLLGLLVSTLLHAMIELPILSMVTSDMVQWGDSWLWRNWHVLHDSVALLLWGVGAGAGLFLGVRFWNILYIEKRYGEPRW